uniref:Eukaryotic translation initiation factor 2A n=1 Tax=Ovis aries TaxID=9940 RepID=A0AC11D1P1_SHEEP
MAPSTPLLTVRGSEGLYMVNGPPHFTESTVFPRESGKNCKAYTFSKDGTLFAWGNGENTPGLPVHHQLPEFTQTHVHRVGDAIQPSHPLSSTSPAPNPS